MIQRPPRTTRTDTLIPHTTRFRFIQADQIAAVMLGLVHGRIGLCEDFIRVDLMAVEQHQSDVDSAVVFDRSEEHTSELHTLMRNSYALVCLKKRNCI